MKKAICYLLIFSVLNTGCATIFNGSNANVSIRSEEPGSKIYIDDTYVGADSAVYSVRKKGNHSIRVSKPGCQDQTAPIGKQFDPTSLLGILIDFGIITTLLIDGAITGAINDIEPKSYVLSPNCPASAASAQDDDEEEVPVKKKTKRKAAPAATATPAAQ